MAQRVEFPEVDAVILGAVHREVAALFDLLPASSTLNVAGEPFRLGELQGLKVLVGATGLGKVNAAVTAAALLSVRPVRIMLNVGCAGAYAESPLRIGDVLVTDRFLLGDEGVLTQEGAHSIGEIGIPVVTRGGEAFFDLIPEDSGPEATRARERAPAGIYHVPEEPPIPLAERLARLPEVPGGDVPALGDASGIPPRFPVHGTPFRLLTGPGLTVGMASGDAATAAARFRRFGAWTENMEGSALAQACFRFRVPFIECRGVGNIAGNRDLSVWRIDEASRNALGVALRLAGIGV